MSIRVRLRPMARGVLAKPPVCIGWQADGADFRVDDPAASLVDIWIQVAGLSPKIWAEIPNIGAGETKTVYLYYGNTTVATVSNGPNTWDFFDEFANLNAWTVKNGTWSADGVAHQTDGIHSEPWTDGLEANSPPAIVNRKVLCRLRTVAGGDMLYAAFSGKWSNTNNMLHTELRDQDDIIRDVAHIAALWKTAHDYALAIVTGGWYLLETTFYGSSIKTYLDQTKILEFTDAEWNQSWTGLQLHTYESYADFDWIAVGKYTEPDPPITVGDVEAGAWVLNGDVFTCRRAIEIDNSGGGALSNYQIEIWIPLVSPCFGDKVVSIV